MGLDSVELVMAWEEAFGITIPNAAAEGMSTVGNATDWITNHLASIGRPLPRAEVFEVCETTCEQCATTRDRLSEDTNFVNDLGID